jgi:hypothetical protein
MKLNKFATIFATVATATAIGITGQEANAGTLKGGWNYAIDSFHDGVTGGLVNQSTFEFYGIAIKEDAEKIYVALNTNLSLNGKASSNAGNGFIGYGDLLFNFSGNNLKKANNQRSLFAIRFDDMNDSNANSTGVYSNVKAKSVTTSNSGFGTLNSHANKVNNNGGSADMADLAQNDNYFKDKTFNVIESGTKVGDIDYLTVSDFNELNLDFGQFDAVGSQTIGFGFDKSLLPTGDYLAHLLAECANDGMAITGQFTGNPGGSEDVPEPITGLIAAAGLGGAALRKMKKSQKNA